LLCARTDARRLALSRAMDKVNNRFGRDAVTLGHDARGATRSRGPAIAFTSGDTNLQVTALSWRSALPLSTSEHLECLWLVMRGGGSSRCTPILFRARSRGAALVVDLSLTALQITDGQSKPDDVVVLLGRAAWN
jgi:hypothetical protein